MAQLEYPLSDSGKRVVGYFQILHLTLQREDCLAISPNEVGQIQEMNARFIRLASTVGLFNPAHSSLDYILRDNDQIRNFTNDLLRNLYENLREVDDLVSRRRVPFESLDSEVDDDLSLASDAADAALSDYASSAGSQMAIIMGGVGPGDSDTELALLIEQMSSTVDQLFSLALQIRNPKTRKVPAIHKIDLYKHVHPSFRENFIRMREQQQYAGLVQMIQQWRKEAQGTEVDHTNEMEPLQNEDEILIRRFLKTNHVRRCRFQYWRRYRLKSKLFTHAATRQDDLLKPTPPDTGSVIPQSIVQSTIHQPESSIQPSSRLSSELPLPVNFALKAPASSSSSKMATIITTDPDGLVTHWPVPPINAREKRTEFECPFCFFLCPYRTASEGVWRDHLRHDLQPYQCTYVDCEESHETYYDYNSWNMHEQRIHRRVWVCNFADKSTFTDQGLYKAHIQQAHPEQSSKLLTPEFISSRETTPKECDRCCPICLRGFSYTHKLQQHIARHLESIALLALPPEEDVESTSDRKSSMDSHIAELRHGLQALSTSNDFFEDSETPPKFSENDNDSGDDGVRSEVHQFHLADLSTYLDNQYSAEFEEANLQFRGGIVNRKHWAKLFRLDDIVVELDNGEPLGYVVTSAPTFDEGSLVLQTWSWKFDGKFFKETTELRMYWPSSSNTFYISNLRVHPLRFSKLGMENKLRARGQMFWKCRWPIFVSYGDHQQDMTVKLRYMVDYKTYKLFHPEADTHVQYALSDEQMQRTEPPADPFIFLLPANILGYGFHNEQWSSLLVELIHSVQWNKAAFDRLVLDVHKKDVLRALANNLARSATTGLHQGHFDNRGFIMLLHGEPGTGKTMTAESFAEMIEKPLYRIAFANIGRELGEAEKYLVSVFNIATIWNCVVLIDEANIFLESRSSSSDLERNAMVSMFLRCIEHYDGMLILTSSGRAAIDEAFKSRLHVTLAYATPGKTERCIMWKDFIQSLSDNGVDLDYGEISETWDQLASQELNGREISNLCSTAQMLARHRGQTLRYSHLEEAMAAMKDFKKYLKETPGDGDMGDKISI